MDQRKKYPDSTLCPLCIRCERCGRYVHVDKPTMHDLSKCELPRQDKAGQDKAGQDKAGQDKAGGHDGTTSENQR